MKQTVKTAAVASQPLPRRATAKQDRQPAGIGGQQPPVQTAMVHATLLPLLLLPPLLPLCCCCSVVPHVLPCWAPWHSCTGANLLLPLLHQAAAGWFTECCRQQCS